MALATPRGMKKLSFLKFVAAAVLASGGVIAACASHTDSAAQQFPMDRYEAAQANTHTEQLLRTAQADPYARDAGVGSGSGKTTGDAGAGKGGTGDAGSAPHSTNPNNPANPANPTTPANPTAPGAPPSTTPTPLPPAPTPTPTPPTPSPAPGPMPTPPPAGAPAPGGTPH